MGLSSSQARLLNLTNRMHQIEYKAAKLEAEKLQMANESAKAYDEYLDALETTKLQSKTLASDGSISYGDVTKFANLTAAGFALKCIQTFTYPKTGGTGSVTKDSIITAVPSGMTDDETTIMNLINSGYFVVVEKKDPAQGFTSENLNETSVATNTALREITDEKKLKKAEAKYEADMKKIDMKDRKFDTDLAALDAERNAVKSEMDTLKTVAKENVDRTFKIFS